ncbi:MAG TPA: tRNA glutamyl-Q(34) synthetase GluQRS [Rhizomicrobium sp.]|jgi:glutamyl-Q tRNA(Asp) synthetase|nr:tRNA glutamyl-Q(34) synthetase GluQRS [Rhizomicrobium sp.]
MIVTRFAPSPTGLLHLGHAYAAFVAAGNGERFLLRIEDIDRARCRAEFEAAICEDLAWLGVRWEMPVLRQSTRFAAYRAALDDLAGQDLIYPCFCTRADIAAADAAPHGPQGALYPRTCRALPDNERQARIARGDAYALRLDVAKAASLAGELSFVEYGKAVRADPRNLGDIVLARKETPASYHLAVVVDDAYQGVTLVTRGEDLLAATPVQRLLQALLGLPAPSYAHHRLILDEQGRKFSKRDHAVTLRALRESGVTPDDIRGRLGIS